METRRTEQSPTRMGLKILKLATSASTMTDSHRAKANCAQSHGRSCAHVVVACCAEVCSPRLHFRRQRRRRFNEYYYAGSYYGAPASNLLYELAQQLNRENNDMLWLSIVGGTEQFLLQQCDADQYNLLVAEFQKEVLAKNTEKQQSTEASDGTMIPVEGSGIWFENEYRFMLHRHWSLFDSMHHSAYIASRLGTWKSSGESSVGERGRDDTDLCDCSACSTCVPTVL